MCPTLIFYLQRQISSINRVDLKNIYLVIRNKTYIRDNFFLKEILYLGTEVVHFIFVEQVLMKGTFGNELN
jgi:hypothetical protein